MREFLVLFAETLGTLAAGLGICLVLALAWVMVKQAAFFRRLRQFQRSLNPKHEEHA